MQAARRRERYAPRRARRRRRPMRSSSGLRYRGAPVAAPQARTPARPHARSFIDGGGAHQSAALPRPQYTSDISDFSPCCEMSWIPAGSSIY